MKTRPEYTVYAGWYGQDETWYEHGRWTPCERSLDNAVELLNAYQQMSFDFCGIQVDFAS